MSCEGRRGTRRCGVRQGALEARQLVEVIPPPSQRGRLIMPLAGHGIARLRDVTTRSISPENLDGGKGGGGRASEGTGAYAARDLGPGWKVSPSVIIGAGAHVAHGRDRRSRHDHPHLAHDRPRALADFGAPGVLGSCGRASNRGATRRLLRQRLGPVRSGQLQHDRRQPARRLQLLLADALPAPRHGSRSRTWAAPMPSCTTR